MKGTEVFSEAAAVPGTLPPGKIWILGAGRFGSIAARRLTKRFPNSDFLVIDHRGERLEEIRQSLGLPVLRREAAAFLLEEPIPRDAWLIPAVPVHVASLWISNRLGGLFIRVPVPTTVDAQVPNPYRTSDGTLYASFATFICPDVCNEPDETCTFTGKPRPGNLFERLQAIQVPLFDVVVVRSWQLAPGVGGYPAAYLDDKLNEAKSKKDGLLIATSCRCHGVIDALSRVSPN